MVSRKFVGVTAVAGIAALGGWMLVTRAQQRPAGRHAVSLDSHQTLGSPSAFRNLTVFPVFDSSTRNSDVYTTLDEGLKARQVKVKESKDGGNVNTLYVTNSGRKPLYLMAGEVVLGGQQDRTLARDTVVAPGKSHVPITVFCVEHGRWTGRAEFAESAPSAASPSIRASAMNGEFNAAKGQIAARTSSASRSGMAAQQSQLNSYTRSSAAPANAGPETDVYRGDDVANAQQKVWDGVAEKNAKFKIRNQTGTYRDALTLRAGDTRTSVPAYIKSLSGSLGSDRHLVGAVAAVNGKIIAADIFADPVLFRKLWPKLLRSYAADAVEQAQGASSASGRKSAVTVQEVKRFMAQAKNEKAKEENINSDGRTLRYDSKDASVYSLIVGGKSAGVAEKPLHESMLHK